MSTTVSVLWGGRGKSYSQTSVVTKTESNCELVKPVNYCSCSVDPAIVLDSILLLKERQRTTVKASLCSWLALASSTALCIMALQGWWHTVKCPLLYHYEELCRYQLAHWYSKYNIIWQIEHLPNLLRNVLFMEGALPV